MRPVSPTRSSITLIALVAILVVAVPAAFATTETAADTRTPIMQPARLTADELASWYDEHRPEHWPPRATVDVPTLATFYLEEGRTEGVAGDLAFAQAVLETAYFHFPSSGQVRPLYNNFGGIGACDGGGCQVARWPDARRGVRGQIHHLRAYADPTVTVASLAHPLESPRFHLVTKGIAPNWENLGRGRWASDPHYATKILRLYASMLDHARTFTDVPDGSIHHASIQALYDAGVTRGCALRAFCPTDVTTRGQMAVFLFRALELPAVGGGPFTDVRGEQRLATSALARAGLVLGCEPTAFCPDQPITRGQMATLLVRTLSLPTTDGAPRFSDVDGRWMQARMIEAVADAGISRGYPDGTFRPRDPVTRAQMASFLHRAGLLDG